MNVFVYDAYLGEKKHERILNRIETRITDLGLNGKIVRLGMLKNIDEAVVRELKQGAKTLIAVGDNSTLNQIINAQMTLNSSELPFGYVPIGMIPVGSGNNSLARSLGLTAEEEACDFLAARRVEMLDLGNANNLYFLGYAEIENQNTVLEIDRNYSLEIMSHGKIRILNLPPLDGSSRGFKPNPQDRHLEISIEAITKKLLPLRGRTVEQSIFSFRHLLIMNKTKPLSIDGSREIALPAEIKIAPHQLPFIVGKNREF